MGRLVLSVILLLFCGLQTSFAESVSPFVEEPTIESTCLFTRRGDDLRQIVNVAVELSAAQPRMRIKLTSDNGWSVEQTFSDLDVGKHELEIEIDPVEKEQAARAVITIGETEYESKITLKPELHWKLYIMPSTHFDYGYTDIQDETMKVHRNNLERAIDWCGEYPGFVWNLEASFVAEDYVRNGSRPFEFIRLAQEGRIGVHGFYGNPLTGICSSEGLSRYMDFYDFLRHSHGIESMTATQNDVPTMVWTVPMILAEHGIKYMSHGQNRVRVGGHQAFDKIPFYWESPDGSRVLSWKVVGSYAQSQWLTGRDDVGDFGNTRRGVRGAVRDFTRHGDYPYDAILIHGAFGDNLVAGKSIASIPDQWNRTYAYPELVMCRGAEFFEYIEANFADKIPTLKACGGVYWEDGAGSSALETAITRVAKEELLTAEKLTALGGPWFQRWMKSRFEEAWSNVLLYDEHTWGANVSVKEPDAEQTLGQWAVKKSFADRAAELSRDLVDQAMDRFVSGLRVGADSVVVFNPSGWARSEIVSFTGSDGKLRSLLADSVPAMGYKTFALSQSRDESEKSAPGQLLENRYYRLEFDSSTGSITSIYDKELERELLDESPYGANAYLYVTGYAGKDAPLTIAQCESASMQRVALPGRQIMKIESRAPMTRSFISEVVLYDDEKRIDFINSMDKESNLEKESGYFAFPFAFEKPNVRIEIPHGVMRPEKDQYTGACRDWYAAQHFVTVSDDSAAVAWTAVDSPLLTVQDINREKFMQQLNVERGWIFGYAFNNLWFTNYKAAQDGPLTFRFAMTSGREISDADAKRFGESVQSPMLARVVAGASGAQSERSSSFVDVDAENVLLQVVKPARFTAGTVVRLREMDGRSGSVRVRVKGIDFKKAWLSNLGEDKISELPISEGCVDVPYRALGLATVILER